MVDKKKIETVLIRVSREIRQWLHSKKMHPSLSYNDVLEELKERTEEALGLVFKL